MHFVLLYSFFVFFVFLKKILYFVMYLPVMVNKFFISIQIGIPKPITFCKRRLIFNLRNYCYHFVFYVNSALYFSGGR